MSLHFSTLVTLSVGSLRVCTRISAYFSRSLSWSIPTGMEISVLQQALIRRISETEDENILKAVASLLDTANSMGQNSDTMAYTDRMIAQSRKELEAGEGIDQATLFEDIHEWLTHGK